MRLAVVIEGDMRTRIWKERHGVFFGISPVAGGDQVKILSVILRSISNILNDIGEMVYELCPGITFSQVGQKALVIKEPGLHQEKNENVFIPPAYLCCLPQQRSVRSVSERDKQLFPNGHPVFVFVEKF